jgi:phosphohistidine phosphatase
MLRLSLLRHAKSSWDDSVRTDFERPLNAKGRRAAAMMGAFAAREGLLFDLVIASPALRVRQTIEGMEDGLARALNPVFDSRIYMASAPMLIDVLAGVPTTAARVLLIGHNPGLEDLAFALVGEGGRGEIEAKYPTASLAELELAGDGWAALAGDCGRLVRFTRPRDLDAGLGPDPNED